MSSGMDVKPPTYCQRLLRRAAARKLVIPSDTRVDPAMFPEDEFPVFCSKCDYLLHGLPDNRCPECGNEFDRGRLLVQQYVGEYGKRSHPTMNQWISRTWLTGTVIMALGFIPLAVMQFLDQQTGGIAQAPGFGSLLRSCVLATISTWLVGVVPLTATFVLSVRLAVMSRHKRRQVLSAIDCGQPAFVAAQRDLWFLPALLFGVGAAFGAWYLLSVAFGWSGAPVQLLHLVLSMTAGCGTAVGILLVGGCVRRPKKS